MVSHSKGKSWQPTDDMSLWEVRFMPRANFDCVVQSSPSPASESCKFRKVLQLIVPELFSCNAFTGDNVFVEIMP